MMRPHRPRAASFVTVFVLAIIAACATTPAWAAPSPEAIRACVEDNLARYSDPANAVRAQYADIEATCRSAIDDGDVVVGFSGDADDDAAPAAGAGDRPDATGGDDREVTDPAPASPGAAPAAAGADGDRPRPRDPAAPAAATTSAVAVVRSAASGAPDAGEVLPSADGDGPAWLFIILGAGGTLIVGAAAMAVRRRLN